MSERNEYRRNFLKPVVFRLDFREFIPNEKIFSEAIESMVLQKFPFKGSEQNIQFKSVNVNLNTNEATSNFQKGKKKVFYSSNLIYKVDELILSNMYLIMRIFEYKSFNIHIDSFIRMMDVLFTHVNNLAIGKASLRYINLYDEMDIKLQKHFFKDNIAATLLKNIVEDDSAIKLIRSMHVNEYRTENLKIIFQYGMYNPQYPARLHRNTFVLDYQSFTNQVLCEKESILNFLGEGHRNIKKLFEESITDNLRKIMKNG